MIGASHDRLRTRQLEPGIVALAEGAVPIARQKVADGTEAHLTIGLGVAAATNVEIELIVSSCQDSTVSASSLVHNAWMS